jgi:hypothetical protein
LLKLGFRAAQLLRWRRRAALLGLILLASAHAEREIHSLVWDEVYIVFKQVSNV